MGHVETSQANSSYRINLLIYIDTELLLAKFPNPIPHPDPKNAVGIGHEFGHMYVTGAVNPQLQGTGDLKFSANVGDTLAVYGTSSSNNFDDAVLIYDMSPFGGTKVLSDFTNYQYSRKAPVPQGLTSAMPANFVEQDFWFYEARVTNPGTEQYKVCFGLYTRGRDGQLSLHGYFGWDPTITVAKQ